MTNMSDFDRLVKIYETATWMLATETCEKKRELIRGIIRDTGIQEVDLVSIEPTALKGARSVN